MGSPYWRVFWRLCRHFDEFCVIFLENWRKVCDFHIMKGIPRLFKGTANNFFLLGPRGTGKTYWVYENYPGALRIDLLSAETYRLLKGNPELLEDWVINDKSKQYIVID